MSRPVRSSRGFTLIELLVVIAIIAILVALLLPAVQQVREAARKSQCQDHLHNIAVAIADYEITHKVLPPRQIGTGTNQSGQQRRTRMAGFYSILPFVEQKGLYDQMVTLNLEPWNGNNAFRTIIDLYNCPSDPQLGDLNDPVRTRGQRNYVFCTGDSVNVGRVPQAASTNVADSVVPTRGAFAALTTYSMRDLTDGTSNTALVSERVRPSSPTGFGGVADGAHANPAACAIKLNTSTNTLTGAFTSDTLPGSRWADGGEIFSGFTTILPPNGASCFFNTTDTVHWRPLYATASSRHPGGAQVAMGDAKVAFISENVDSGNQAAAPPTATGGGLSPYGVWGCAGHPLRG